MKPIRFYLIAVLVVLADQITKWSAIKYLAGSTSEPIIGSHVRLTLTHNSGGAFSIFPARNSTFVVIAIVAVFALSIAYQRYQRVNTIVSTALALALGGAIGNLIDRIRFQYVVDFIDFHIIRWPVFNVADSAITIGIVLLSWSFLFTKEPVPEKKPAETAAELPE